MPKLRHLWPEWEDDERWWIHPLESTSSTNGAVAVGTA